MTQRITTEESINKVWGRIGNDEGSQMAWFVKLANTKGFATMSTDTQLLWQEEFMAIMLRGHEPVMKAPLDRKRYPRSDSPVASMMDPPTPIEMQEVRAVIRQPINDLADGRQTWIPPLGSFEISYSVKFMGNPAHFNKPHTEPRYLVFHNEVGGDSGPNPYQRPLLLRLLRLLEAYPDKNRRDTSADKLRRCPHCQEVFLQVKRSSRYCQPKCYQRAGMKRLRAERKAQQAMKKAKKTRLRKPAGKGG